MKPVRTLAATLLLGVFGLAGTAHAAPCAGFTDVDDASGFCPNVEWLKNRGITLGCTSATLYCPDDAVLRITMAAFLNRLANALTPVYRGISEGFAANLSTSTRPCAAPAYAVTGFPRLAHGHAAVTAEAIGASADFSVQFVVSTDGGATYSPASPIHNATAVPNARGPSLAVILPPQALSPGTNYRWALQITRTTGSATTGNITGACQLYVLIENRNGTSSPLDPHD